MPDYRDLPPVDVPAPRPPRASQTLLALYDECPRAAYLTLSHGGGAPSHEMARGSLFHSFAERAMGELVAQVKPGQPEPSLWAAHTVNPRTGEIEPEDDTHSKRAVASLTGDMIDALARERRDLHCSTAEIDNVRVQAYHWAVGYDVAPSSVVDLERKFVLRVGDWTVSGKVDVIASVDGDPFALQVDDYKTSPAFPSQEAFERDFQLAVYGCLIAFGVPVEKRADGTEVELDPVGDRTQRFRLRQVFPKFLGDDGVVWFRETTVDRTRLQDFMVDLRRVVDALDGSFETGKWPAVPGSWCDTKCPAASECPLPPALRGVDWTIETREDAAAAMEYVTLEELRLARIKKAAKVHAPFYIGDLVWEIRAREATVTDHEALTEALRAGRPSSIEAFQKKRRSGEFRKRRVTAEDNQRGDGAA